VIGITTGPKARCRRKHDQARQPGHGAALARVPRARSRAVPIADDGAACPRAPARRRIDHLCELAGQPARR
jgi:hypothetical protein